MLPLIKSVFLSISIMTERPFTGPGRPQNGTIASVVFHLFASRPKKQSRCPVCPPKLRQQSFFPTVPGWILALVTLLCPVAHFLCD